MHWPQVTMLLIIAIEIAYAMFKDGKPKEGNYSIWVAIFSYGLFSALLYYGGFWL